MLAHPGPLPRHDRPRSGPSSTIRRRWKWRPPTRCRSSWCAVLLLWVQRRLMGRRGYTTVGGRARRAPPSRSAAGGGPPSRPAGASSCSRSGCRTSLSSGPPSPRPGARVVVAERHAPQLPLRPLRVRPDAVGHRRTRSSWPPSRRRSPRSSWAPSPTSPSARLVTGAPALAFLAMAPLAIPGIVLSIGLFKAYSRPPVLLYGTIWIIFVAYLTKYLPIAYTACHAALQTVHVDLEDAARDPRRQPPGRVQGRDGAALQRGARLGVAPRVPPEPSRAVLVDPPLHHALPRGGGRDLHPLRGGPLGSRVRARDPAARAHPRSSWRWRSGSWAGASSRSDRRHGRGPARGRSRSGSAPNFAAVRELTLEIRHGELLSLLGPSGCGKTTTLRLIAGFLAPEAGEIWLGDRRLSAPRETVPPERRGMSMLFQSYAVWPHKTVAENVTYGLKFRGRAARGLAPAPPGGARPGAPRGVRGPLPGGALRRPAAAGRARPRAVVEPAILLLDEPLSNLDANLREEMRFEIRRVHEAFQITTVYVTHDQAEAMVTSDRIAVMNAGRIEQVGTPIEIYERPATAFVAGFIGRTNLLKRADRGRRARRLRGRPRSRDGRGPGAPARRARDGLDPASHGRRRGSAGAGRAAVRGRLRERLHGHGHPGQLLRGRDGLPGRDRGTRRRPCARRGRQSRASRWGSRWSRASRPAPASSSGEGTAAARPAAGYGLKSCRGSRRIGSAVTRTRS